MKGIRFIPDGTNIDFIGKRYIAFAVSLFIIIGTFSLCMTKGLNFGIDFTGGTVIEVRVPTAPVLSDLRTEINHLGLGEMSLQEFGDPLDLMIRLPEQKEDETAKKARESCLEKEHDQTKCPLSPQQLAINKLHEHLDARFEAPVEYRRTEYVGPQVGAELKKTAALAIIWSIIGILAYVWFRFEWQFGVSTVVALAHDVIGTVGLFALTQMQFDLSTLAAILLIAGYSTNDSVVIFDRIRENMRKYKKIPLNELINKSTNQTLSRTILTGGTTLLALIALWVFGGAVIQGFVNALIFGIIIGTFSSIYVGSPMLIYLKVRRENIVSDEAGDAQEQAG